MSRKHRRAGPGWHAALLLGLCLQGASLHAGEWLPLRYAGDANRHSYDLSKLVVNADDVLFWRKVNFSSPQTARSGLVASALFREKLDCAQHTLQTQAWLLYDKEGRLLDQSASADKEASPIAPDTLADALEQAVCRIAAQRQAVRPRKPVTPVPTKPAEGRAEAIPDATVPPSPVDEVAPKHE